jgi:hypothetical protein
MDEKALADLFARLGARNPDQWARSQVEEGVPQLARFLFLRQAWKFVISDRDSSWLDKQFLANTGGPGGAIAPALRRILACGVDREDLTTVVRVMQWRVLAGLCYLLDDPGDLEDDIKDIAWRLFEVDENGRPVAVMGALQESVLATDPSGKEMRP